MASTPLLTGKTDEPPDYTLRSILTSNALCSPPYSLRDRLAPMRAPEALSQEQERVIKNSRDVIAKAKAKGRRQRMVAARHQKYWLELLIDKRVRSRKDRIQQLGTLGMDVGDDLL